MKIKLVLALLAFTLTFAFSGFAIPEDTQIEQTEIVKDFGFDVAVVDAVTSFNYTTERTDFLSEIDVLKIAEVFTNQLFEPSTRKGITDNSCLSYTSYHVKKNYPYDVFRVGWRK